MYTFTSYGRDLTDEPTTVTAYAEESLSASDVRHLPLWLAAAQNADEAGYCEVYDRIASEVGGPTRHDLREAGLLKSTFTVTGYRQVTVTVEVPFSVEVEATRPADIRNDHDLVEAVLGSISGWDVRDHVDGYESVEADDLILTGIERD
jgi:hypothetical protein